MPARSSAGTLSPCRRLNRHSSTDANPHAAESNRPFPAAMFETYSQSEDGVGNTAGVQLGGQQHDGQQRRRGPPDGGPQPHPPGHPHHRLGLLRPVEPEQPAQDRHPGSGHRTDVQQRPGDRDTEPDDRTRLVQSRDRRQFGHAGSDDRSNHRGARQHDDKPAGRPDQAGEPDAVVPTGPAVGRAAGAGCRHRFMVARLAALTRPSPTRAAPSRRTRAALSLPPHPPDSPIGLVGLLAHRRPRRRSGTCRTSGRRRGRG